MCRRGPLAARTSRLPGRPTAPQTATADRDLGRVGRSTSIPLGAAGPVARRQPDIQPDRQRRRSETVRARDRSSKGWPRSSRGARLRSRIAGPPSLGPDPTAGTKRRSRSPSPAPRGRTTTQQPCRTGSSSLPWVRRAGRDWATPAYSLVGHRRPVPLGECVRNGRCVHSPTGGGRTCGQPTTGRNVL